MEFSRIGKHTIKCVISEEELENMGYSVDDLMTNSERTQEFINYIFDMAEREFEIEFHPEIKTVRADFLPDHTISLVFSEQPAMNMLEHLKDIISELVGSITPEQLEKFRRDTQAEGAENKSEVIRVIALIYFLSMDQAVSFAKKVSFPKIPENALYRDGNDYVIVMDLSYCTEEEVTKLSMLTDEYADGIEVGTERRAYLEEHAKKIIETQAVETLRLL